MRYLDLPISSICDEYLSGSTPMQLSKKYNCSEPTITSRLKESGIKMRSRSESQIDKVGDKNSNYFSLNDGDMVSDYLSGDSPTKIAKKFGCQADTIRRHLVSSGVELRSSPSKSLTGLKRSSEQRKNISDGIKAFYRDNPGIYCGINSPSWKGGISFEPYCPEFNYELKQQIRNNYNNCDFMSGLPDCICNVLNGKVWKLDIHHVDSNKMQGCDGIKWKLVPLSRSNHIKTHYSVLFWEKLICYALECDETYSNVSDDEISEFNEVFNA